MSAPRVLSLALACLVVAACGTISSSPPPAGPDDFVGISRRMAASGVTIQHVVSGDAGCDDPQLGRTAIRFEASGVDQAQPATVYLYIFRNRAAFQRNRPVVAGCAGAYAPEPPGAQRIEVSPYILVAAAPLAPGLADALTNALREAAGTGG